MGALCLLDMARTGPRSQRSQRRGPSKSLSEAGEWYMATSCGSWARIRMFSWEDRGGRRLIFGLLCIISGCGCGRYIPQERGVKKKRRAPGWLTGAGCSAKPGLGGRGTHRRLPAEGAFVRPWLNPSRHGPVPRTFPGLSPRPLLARAGVEARRHFA
jgi:hypothetical protein